MAEARAARAASEDAAADVVKSRARVPSLSFFFFGTRLPSSRYRDALTRRPDPVPAAAPPPASPTNGGGGGGGFAALLNDFVDGELAD